MDRCVDPLFAGATRPTMMWGVSYEAIVVCFMTTAIVFLAAGNPFYLVIYAPMHGFAYLVCLKDPRAFRLFFLWAQTKGRSTSRRYWTVSSAAPLVNTRGTFRRK